MTSKIKNSGVPLNVVNSGTRCTCSRNSSTDLSIMSSTEDEPSVWVADLK